MLKCFSVFIFFLVFPLFKKYICSVWMDDGTDDGTKLHFIPTSFSISWWAESCSVRLSRGRDGLQPATSELPGCRFAWTTGRMDRGTTGQMDDGTDSGEASFHPDVRSHCPSGFRGSFICPASGEASFVRLQGKLHSSFTICNHYLV